MGKEIHPRREIDTEVIIPGSKSYTNRALVCSALAETASLLRNAAWCDDTMSMRDGLNGLGAKIAHSKRDFFVLGKHPTEMAHTHDAINVGAAGTTLRFLTGLCCAVPGVHRLVGSERMHQRPIDDLVEGLKPITAGAIIAESTNKKGRKCPPVSIMTDGLHGGTTRMKGNTSSQFISSILMISPYAKNDVEIEIEGELVSKPYVDMTTEVMKHFGIEIENDGYKRFSVKSGQQYRGTIYNIESDASNMSYFLAAAAITGGRIRIGAVNPNSLQSDICFADLLEQMGCGVTWEADYVEVKGPDRLGPVKVDMNAMPDTVQTLAVLAAVADGVTEIYNIGNLRVKETDRIGALQRELERVGIRAETTDESIRIYGGRPHGAEIRTYQDHRMAMSFSVLGLAVPGISIENPQVVSKSFPTFYEQFDSL